MTVQPADDKELGEGEGFEYDKLKKRLDALEARIEKLEKQHATTMTRGCHQDEDP